MKLGITVTGVVIKKKRILLVTDKENRFKFPGGKKEDNESFEDALKREIKEEVSSESQVLYFINAFPATYKGLRWVMFNYRVILENEPRASGEVKSIGWYTYSECQKMPLSPNAGQIVELFHKKGEI